MRSKLQLYCNGAVRSSRRAHGNLRVTSQLCYDVTSLERKQTGSRVASASECRDMQSRPRPGRRPAPPRAAKKPPATRRAARLATLQRHTCTRTQRRTRTHTHTHKYKKKHKKVHCSISTDTDCGARAECSNIVLHHTVDCTTP